MPAIIVLTVGFGVLGLCVLFGRLLGESVGMARAALAFLPLWLGGAGINLYVGVKREGRSIAREASIFLFVFAIPGAAALVLWWMAQH